MHKIWNFERKKFEISHDLIFEETQFPKPNDFDESSADSYNPQTLSSSPSSSSESELTSESDDKSSRQVYNEIIVQLSLALQIFKIYEEFQSDNDPPFFADVMRRSDVKLWWKAFYDEIKAIIARKTWILMRLPPGKRALPLR